MFERNACTPARCHAAAPQVFVTAQARTLDLATALVNQESIMVIVSPGTKEALLQRFDKYIFPADQVRRQCPCQG